MTETRVHSGTAEFRAALNAARRALDKDLRDSIAVLPNPREYAYRMPGDIAEALLCATRRGSAFYLPRAVGLRLRDYGLCDCQTFGLTVFGYAVYRELREMDA